MFRFCLVGDGWSIYQALEDACEAVADNAEVIGTAAAQTVANEMVRALAEDAATPVPKVASDGYDRLVLPLPERIVVLPVYGMNLTSSIDCCGVSLRLFDPEGLGAEFADGPLRSHMHKELQGDKESVRVCAVARLRTDSERGFDITRRRTRLALVLSLLSRHPNDHHWWDEWSATFFPTTTFAMRTFTAEASTTGFGATRYGLPLQFEAELVTRALPLRPGMHELEGLAVRAQRDLTDMQARLIRAAVLLAESLDGLPPERFMKRWMALEALVGKESGEVTERTSERLAVLTTDDLEQRIRRKTFFRELYGERSHLAHGRSVPLLKRRADLFKFLAFGALERASLFAASTETAFFEALEAAKFRGTPLRDVQWLESPFSVHV